jgi:Transposase
MTTETNGLAFAIAAESASADKSTDTNTRSRVVVIRTARRWRWSPDQQWAIIAEARMQGVSSVGNARKHGIATGQLYSCRRRWFGLRAPRLAVVIKRGRNRICFRDLCADHEQL